MQNTQNNWFKIVREYGKVLELTADHIASAKSFLPYPKEKIRAALLAASISASNDEKEQLAIAYMQLGSFVSDDDATIVSRYERWLKDQNNSVHPEDSNLAEQYAQILKSINEEENNLLKEFRAFEKSIQEIQPKSVQ